MVVLDRLYKDHEFPLPLYSKIKKAIKYNYTEDLRNVSEFVEELPHNLKNELSIHIYETLYKEVEFLNEKSEIFISWICPMMKGSVATPNEYIFYEGDEIQNIYFLRSSNCYYVLPKYSNAKYIRITKGTYFGIIDIIAGCFEEAEEDEEIDQSESLISLDQVSERSQGLSKLEKWFNLILKRKFTVLSNESEPIQLLTLSKQDLIRMKLEFGDCYDDLFTKSF